jgi:hypothetical protein
MVGALAMLSCAPLVASLPRAKLPLLLLLLVLAGFGGSCQLAAARAVVQAMSDGHPGQAFGVAQSGLLAAQEPGDPDRGSGHRYLSPPAANGMASLDGRASGAGEGL